MLYALCMNSTTTARPSSLRTTWLADGSVSTVLRQIGSASILAVSGGRSHLSVDGAIVLPVQYGHQVAVYLDEGADLYRVEHQFRRGGKVTVKAVWTDVYADNLADVVYVASCWRDR